MPADTVDAGSFPGRDHPYTVGPGGLRAARRYYSQPAGGGLYVVQEPTPEQEIVVVGPDEGESEKKSAEDRGESVQHPAKVMRIGTMVRQLLDEVRAAPLDDASRSRLREIYETSVAELAEVLSEDLQEELGRLSLPFDKAMVPSDSELRVAHAQLVGWLEGLFHGIQAMMFAQQLQQQQVEGQHRGLPAPPGSNEEPGRGTYL